MKNAKFSFIAIFALLILCVSGPLSWAQDDFATAVGGGAPDDVRGFIWGVSAADVAEYEKASYYGNFQNTVTYYGEDKGLEAYITYFFADDALYQAQIDYKLNYANPQLYMDRYFELLDTLEGQFGPSNRLVDFENSYDESIPQRWGIATLKGDATFEARWDTERSLIRLAFSGEDFQARIVHQITSKTIAGEDFTPVYRDITTEKPF